jgi:hypothetical protein
VIASPKRDMVEPVSGTAVANWRSTSDNIISFASLNRAWLKSQRTSQTGNIYIINSLCGVIFREIAF